MFPFDSFPNITSTCSFIELNAAKESEVRPQMCTPLQETRVTCYG